MGQKTTKITKQKSERNFLNYLLNNKKLIYLIFAILFITILIVIIWPLVYQGQITIISSNYPATINLCRTYADKSNVTTNNESNLGCKSSDINIFNLSEKQINMSLTPGKYYISATKQKYQKFEQNFTIEFQKTTTIDIKLEPIGITINDQLIHDYKYDKNTNIIYYLYEEIVQDENQNSYTQFAVDKTDGSETINLFKTNEISQIKKTFWSPDFEKLIISDIKPDNTEIKYLINIPSNSISETKLPDQDIMWSGDSTSVYYLYQDQKEDQNQIPPSEIPPGAGYRAQTIYGPNHNTITQAQPDGSNWQVIHKLDNNLYDIELSKSSDDRFFAITTSNFEGFIFDSTTKSLTQLDKNILFNKIDFSLDNQILLAETVNNNYRPLLQFAYLNNLSFVSLDTITFLTKTCWIGNNQIAAAIGDYIPSTNLNDILNTSDRIKLIDLSTSNISESEWNTTNPVIDGAHNLSGDQNSLFLIDKDNYLYFIPRSLSS